MTLWVVDDDDDENKTSYLILRKPLFLDACQSAAEEMPLKKTKNQKP